MPELFTECFIGKVVIVISSFRNFVHYAHTPEISIRVALLCCFCDEAAKNYVGALLGTGALEKMTVSVPKL